MMAVYSPGGRTEHRPFISKFICQGRPEIHLCFILYTHISFVDYELFFVFFCIRLHTSFLFLLTSSNILIHHIRRILCSSFWTSLVSFPFYCGTSSMRQWRRNLQRTIALLLNIELLYFVGYLSTAPFLSFPRPTHTIFNWSLHFSQISCHDVSTAEGRTHTVQGLWHFITGWLSL